MAEVGAPTEPPSTAAVIAAEEMQQQQESSQSKEGGASEESSGQLLRPSPPTADSYIKTTTGNFVSRQAEITNAKNVEIKGRSWIEEKVVIRGDLAKIRMGRYCKLSLGTSLVPAPATPTGGATSTARTTDSSISSGSPSVPHVPIVIGSHTIIGSDCDIRAAAIGSYCWIGKNVVIGQRVFIKDACVIDDNVTLGDDTVVPPFTRVSTFNTHSLLPSTSMTTRMINQPITTTSPSKPVLQMIELPPATIQLLQEESMEIYNLYRKTILASA